MFEVRIYRNSKWVDGGVFNTQKEMNGFIREWKKETNRKIYDARFDICTYKNNEFVKSVEWSC